MTPGEHIAAVIARHPTAVFYGPRTWTDAINSWSSPLPENRPWRMRHGGYRVRAGRSDWQRDPQLPPRLDRDPLLDVGGDVDAARAAWHHLNACGLVDTGDPADIVTVTLRPDHPATAA